jgi:hypothetical protein
MPDTAPIPDAPSAPASTVATGAPAPASTAATGAPAPDDSTTGLSPPPPGKLQAHDIRLSVVSCVKKQELN